MQVEPVKHENAATRVRRRIAEWVQQEGHGSRKRLADAVKGLYGRSRSSAWVTDIIDGPDRGGQDLRLRDLDAIADEMRVAPGDLVRRDDRQYIEVSSTEARMLRYYRLLPDVIRGHFMAYLDFLHSAHDRLVGEQAEERQRRTTEARGLARDAKLKRTS